MDTVVKTSNKENSKPESGPKKEMSRNVITKSVRSAPLRSKNTVREENAGEKSRTGCKAQVKSSKPTTTNNSHPTQTKTLSRTFRTEQNLRHRKLVLETQKPPLSVPPKPLLPGTYKGRVVQSKIDCFRKDQEKKLTKNETNAEAAVRAKSSTMLFGSSGAGTQSSVVSRTKSRSDMQKTFPTRTATTSNRPATISTKPSTITTKQTTIARKPSTIASKPSTISTKPSTISTKPSTNSTKPSTISTKPPTISTKPSTISNKPSISNKPPTLRRKPLTMSARPPTVTSFIKKKEPSNPPAAASERKPQTSISSSISQYRVRVESAEERRLKLAEWLVSKGKTLKRPTMMEKAALPVQSSKTETVRMSESDGGTKSDEAVRMSESDGGMKSDEAVRMSVTGQSHVPQRKPPAFSDSPSHILNTSLELLENSDTELHTEPHIDMESLVINLCERLEAMETPSSCPEMKVEVKEETPEYEIVDEGELKEEKLMDKKYEEEEEEGEKKKSIRFQTEEEQKLSEGDNREEDDDDDDDDDEILDACVVKYSIKTTPYLQSVKKRMEDEMAPGTPCSRRKSSIKDLKFLTPVRRSSRIHRISSRLPEMLNEHDPCVSSLAELELLDAADSNAYIYRKNAALLHHLPEQCPEPQSSEINYK